MLNEREMKYRLRMAVDQNIPMTNYGVAIAYMTGILERSVRPFITLFHERVPGLMLQSRRKYWKIFNVNQIIKYS